MEVERRLGFEPVDRELEKLGYDIESRDPGHGQAAVHRGQGARRRRAPTITVTRNEILYSLNKPEDFILAIVEFLDGDAHRVHYLRQPFQREPPSAQSPFATIRCYRLVGDVMHLLGGRYPTFIAPTGSCARPSPSPRLWLRLVRGIFAGCGQPLLRNGPSRRYLCRSIRTCLDPYSGGPQGAYTRFFPWDVGLPRV